MSALGKDALMTGDPAKVQSNIIMLETNSEIGPDRVAQRLMQVGKLVFLAHNMLDPISDFP